MAYTEAEKTEVFAAYARGESPPSIARRLRISLRSIRYWVKDLKGTGPRTQEPQDSAEAGPVASEAVDEAFVGSAWEEIAQSVPSALRVLRETMGDSKATAAARLRAAELVLHLAGMTPRVAERRLGRTETTGVGDIDWSLLTPDETDAAILALEKGRRVKGGQG